jgi:hypothetical protein
MPRPKKQFFKEVIMAIQEDRTGTWHAYSKTVANKSKSGISNNSFDDPNKPAFLKSIPFARNSRFANYLAVHFPEVASTIDAEDLGTLHLEVSALRFATHDAILKHDWEAVRTHFDFVDEVLESAETDLHDAIGISYLVNLFYSETSLEFATARTLMPKRLAAALEIMERHYEELN